MILMSAKVVGMSTSMGRRTDRCGHGATLVATSILLDPRGAMVFIWREHVRILRVTACEYRVAGEPGATFARRIADARRLGAANAGRSAYVRTDIIILGSAMLIYCDWS